MVTDRACARSTPRLRFEPSRKREKLWSNSIRRSIDLEGGIHVGAARHLAVWIASIVFFVLGAIWYSLMANPWMAAIGEAADGATRDPAGSPLPYAIGFIAILVMCYTLAWLIRRLGVTTLVAGFRLGAMIAIGFIAATLALNYGFEARPVTLWLINSVYVVVGLAIAGAIIGGWRRQA
jgi:hypothetical protein